MRQAKLLTLSLVVGLSLISHGNSAQAQTPNFPGNVTLSCTVSSSDGALSEDPGIPATALLANGGDRGTVVVVCNDSAKSLQLTINTSSSTLYNGTAKIRFNGTSGGFSGTNLPASAATVSPITLAIANPTLVGGDIGRIQARIDAPTGKLLKVGNYNLVVDAIITP